MNSLSFDLGYKEYTINGDETQVIRVYTSDWNIVNRISKLKGKIIEKVKELESIKDDSGFDEVMDKLAAVEREVRAEIDAAFGSPVCDTVFGSVNCLSFASGKPIALNFLEAIIPEIRKDIEVEAEKANKKVLKYTDSVKGLK